MGRISFSFISELPIRGVPLTYNCHSKRTKHGGLSLYCQIYATEDVTSPLYLAMCSQKFFKSSEWSWSRFQSNSKWAMSKAGWNEQCSWTLRAALCPKPFNSHFNPQSRATSQLPMHYLKRSRSKRLAAPPPVIGGSQGLFLVKIPFVFPSSYQSIFFIGEIFCDWKSKVTFSFWGITSPACHRCKDCSNKSWLDITSILSQGLFILFCINVH